MADARRSVGTCHSRTCRVTPASVDCVLAETIEWATLPLWNIRAILMR